METVLKPNTDKVTEGDELSREWQEAFEALFRKVQELETRVAALEP